MLDPLPRARLIGKLLQDQNLVRIVESLENPGLSNPRGGKPGYRRTDLGGQVGHVVHRRERGHHNARNPWSGLSRSRRRDKSVDDLAGEDRRISSTPMASNQSKKTRERSNSTIGSRLRTPIITSTRPESCVDA